MKIKILSLLLITQFAIAQHRTCGMQQEMQRIMSNPIERQNYLDMQARFEIELAKLQNNANRAAAPTATIRIPVAVHYPTTLGTASTSLKTCLRNLAQSQVDILNADYNGTNTDISQWTGASSFYPGTNTGNLNVEFVLATQNHPAGTGIANGTVAVTFGTDFLGTANADTTWNGYMNLVCRNAGSGVLGYSPLGGTPGTGRTVVLAFTAFGSGAGCTGYVPGAPYNLGRTLTHELGHFFNLDHTFLADDESSTDCSPPDQDGIPDTPKCPKSSYSCPVNGSRPGCETLPSLTMNYMDYVNDACMYMFTAGQSQRMLAWYNTISSQFTTTALSNNDFLANNFSILPNPSNGSFTINLKETLDNYSVQIFDATGRIIFEKEYNQNQDLQQNISLNNSQSGIYFINIKSYSSVLTKKIIIE